MASRRKNTIDLNFDSITDLITNLAGGLILVVLLLIGVTKDAASQTKSPPNTPEPGGQANAGTKSAREVLQRINDLKFEVKAVEDGIRKLEAPLRQARDEAEELLRKVESVQPPKPREEKAKGPEVRTERFRPPIERKVAGKKHRVILVVENASVSILDFESMLPKVDPFLTFDKIRDMEVEVPEGDFNVRIIVKKKTPTTVNYTLEAVRKRDQAGEPMEVALKPGSRFLRRIDRLQPDSDVPVCLVSHDSFDAFRATRTLLMGRQFEMDWNFRSPDEPFRFSLGGAGGGIRVQ
jgi:hypothetical protein